MPRVAFALLILGGFGVATAQPFIFYRGIVNAASFAPPGLPNGAIARGSIFTIFGRNLGPMTPAFAPALPLATSLGGVSIEVCQGTAPCIPALPLAVSSRQINAIMPSNAPLGPANIRVTFNNEAGNFSPARVAASSFGIFAVNSGGFGPGIVTNFVSTTEQPVNSMEVAAGPGQFVTVWGTGLGAALNADNVAPTPGDLPVEVEIWAGGVQITNKLYSGRSPEFPGLDQIVFEIPGGVPDGCYVPVVVRTGRQTVSNTTTIAISSDASSCSDPANPLNAARAGGRVGVVRLDRIHATSSPLLNIGIDFTADLAAGFFQNEPAGPWHFNRVYSLPPAGTCLTYGAHTSVVSSASVAELAANGTRLSAGPQISITGPRTLNVSALPLARNFYGRLLGADLRLPMVSLFFGGGSHQVTAMGGPDIGAFDFTLAPPARLTWTNRDAFDSLARGAPVEVTWSGGDPESLTMILGYGQDRLLTAAGWFVCAARTARGRLTIPGWATAHLPDEAGAAVDGSVSLVALPPSAVRFSATGLDHGFALFTSGQVRGVDVR